MKSFAILYSATTALDYRFIARPDEGYVPKSISQEFEKNIKGLLSNETPIIIPKWIFVKKYIDDVPYALWGTACQNAVFSEDYVNDKKGRPIQCFIGFVVEFPDERLKLPFDTQAFSSLLKEIMSKVWESRDATPLHLPIQIQDFNSTIFVRQSEGNALNYDPSQCRLFPSTYPYIEELFAEAMSAKNEISIAMGIVNRDEVTSPEYCPLFNAILTKASFEIKDTPVLRYCRRCKKPSYSLKDGLCDDCIKTKKENHIIVDPVFPKPKCSVCGQEHDELTDGMCRNCYRESKLVRCIKCGKKVEYVYSHGECEDCHVKRKRKIHIIVFFLIIIVFLVGIGKCVKKPMQQPKPAPRPDIHLMDDGAQGHNKDTLTRV